MQPKRLIIPFDFNQTIYNSSYINHNFHNYSELVKQIFDVMTPNFIKFSEEIDMLPKTETFLMNELIFDRAELTIFKEELKRHALNIYFTCFNFKLFNDNSFDYLLENVYQDYFVLYHVPLPNF